MNSCNGSLFGKPVGSEEGLQAKRSLEDHVVDLGGELMDTLWNVEVGELVNKSKANKEYTTCPYSTPSTRSMVNHHLIRSTTYLAPSNCPLVLLLMVRSPTR